MRVAQEFYDMWNFPNVLGFIDGKHVAIQAPKDAGSEYFNYKGFHSIVLLAMCDAKYCFTVIDCGAAGLRVVSLTVEFFSRSEFGKRYLENNLDFPQNSPFLPGSAIPVPYLCIADAAFPLRKNLMKPYGGKALSRKEMIFNYRLSRARRTIENAFGILSVRWRFLRRTLLATPERACLYVRAACVLHNFMQMRAACQDAGSNVYCPPGFADSYGQDGRLSNGQWRQEEDSQFQTPLTNCPSNRYGFSAANVRDNIASYFVSNEGAVDWQEQVVFATN